MSNRGLNITKKLLVASSLVVIVGLLAGALALGNQVARATEALALREGRAIGQSIAEKVKARMDRGMALAATLADTFAALKAEEQVDRDSLSEILRMTMVGHPSLAGVWAGYEENALDGRDADFKNKDSDDTGRYLTYWYDFKDSKGLTKHYLSAYDHSGPGGYFYTVPFKTNAPFVTEPTTYDIEGKIVFLASLAVPIRENGKAIGVMGVDLQLGDIWNTLSDIHPLGTGSIHVISNDGRWVAYPDPAVQGKPAADTLPFLSDVLDAIRAGRATELTTSGTYGNDDYIHLFLPITLGQTATPWSVMVNLPLSKITEDADALRLSIAIGGLLLLVTLVAALGLIGRNLITHPMAQLTNAVEAIDRGESTVAIHGQDRGDEVGAIARALENFKQNLDRMRTLEKEKLDSERRASEERHVHRTQLADSFENSVGTVIASVSTMANRMRDTAVSMTDQASAVSGQASDVSHAAEAASSNVATVATATEELSASVREIGQQVHRSSDIARDAVTQAQQAKDRVSGLAETSNRIGEVVTLISDIASQTNLLALNATIEAARAGDMGKGFAVVANEVKSLANQTARATDEIAAQIAGIQGETTESVTAMTAIADTIGRISEISGAIASAVEEQGAATREIAQSVQQAAEGTQRVSKTITAVNAAAANSRSSAEGMRDASSSLAAEAEDLRTQVAAFLQSIRR